MFDKKFTLHNLTIIKSMAYSAVIKNIFEHHSYKIRIAAIKITDSERYGVVELLENNLKYLYRKIDFHTGLRGELIPLETFSRSDNFDHFLNTVDFHYTLRSVQVELQYLITAITSDERKQKALRTLCNKELNKQVKKISSILQDNMEQ